MLWRKVQYFSFSYYTIQQQWECEGGHETGNFCQLQMHCCHIFGSWFLLPKMLFANICEEWHHYKTCLFRSCVALSGKNRILGVAAKNQMVTNMRNTIYGFKRLLGRKYSDPHVQQELKYLPFRVTQQPNGSIGVKVRFYKPKECLYIYLTSILS